VTVAHEVLESLGLEDAAPTPQALGDLFTRFQTQLRYRPAPAPRGAEEVLAQFLEQERGCVGGERTLAFLALARAAGFDARLIAAELLGAPHAAVVVHAPEGRALCDAAFPLPSPLALDPPAADEASPYGRLTLIPFTAPPGAEGIASAKSPATGLFMEGIALVVDGRGRSAVRARYSRVEIAEEACPMAPPDPACEVRLFPDRVLRTRDGVPEVLDPWSRLHRQELSVYHRSEAEPAALLARLATPAGLLALYPGGAVAEEVAEGVEGWEWGVTAEPERRRERVRRLPDGLAVELLSGQHPFAAKRYRVEPDGRLVLRATLSRPVPPQGMAEPVRKTLVFHLASELLQLAGA
jgi:hypothetical protein